MKSQFKQVFGNLVFSNDTVFSESDPIDGICTFQYKEDEVKRVSYWRTGRNEYMEVSPVATDGSLILSESFSYEVWKCPTEFEQTINYLKSRYDGRNFLESIKDALTRLSGK